MNEISSKYLPIIKLQYPEVLLEKIKYFDDGHDHYIFLLPNGIAFRFPRGKEYSKKDIVENTFLPEFAKQSPIPIQIFTPHIHRQSNITYQTYNFIYGTGFTKEVAETFSVEECLAIAKQLGHFLRVIHAYPIEKARVIHMDELDPKGYYEFFENIWFKNKEVIYPLLSQEEQQWCDRLFSNYLETRVKSFVPHVTHNDILPEHIIVDKDKNILTGIIDFALRIADPARDFMFLHIYGNDFLETAFSEYGKVDEMFRNRRKFYGGNFYIMYLYNAITRKNNAIEVEKHRNALVSYIAEYPTL